MCFVNDLTGTARRPAMTGKQHRMLWPQLGMNECPTVYGGGSECCASQTHGGGGHIWMRKFGI